MVCTVGHIHVTTFLFWVGCIRLGFGVAKPQIFGDPSLSFFLFKDPEVNLGQVTKKKLRVFSPPLLCSLWLLGFVHKTETFRLKEMFCFYLSPKW